MNKPNIVRKLSNCRNVLCDDKMSLGDYVEELTYLLSSKMRQHASQTSEAYLPASKLSR